MIDLLRRRRSIRVFQQKPVESDKIELLKEACLRSPTSRNRHPWTFIFITDPEYLHILSNAKPHGADFLKHAPLGVVIAADTDKTDVWIEDCSIASILLQMTAQSLGLGSCWIQIRRRKPDHSGSASDYIKEKLDLPPEFKVESIIAIGYPDENKPGIPESDLLTDRIRMI
ncbi:MAG: nitroreductase family protein [candidate division KSB1 bacterium]|nr:nitroreductase family protein [candidate division KSB1 bacterium]